MREWDRLEDADKKLANHGWMTVMRRKLFMLDKRMDELGLLWGRLVFGSPSCWQIHLSIYA